MSAIPLLLLGAGGHARACIDVIEAQGQYAVRGVVGQKHEVGQLLLGYPVIADDGQLAALCADGAALVAVGQIKSPEVRIRLFESLIAAGGSAATVVSPRAYVSRHARIGAGSIVMHGAIVNAGAVVGRNCIINSQALIEHDAEIGDHCHVSTNATVNGNARVGAGTFLGSGSVVREGITIGDRCVVPMGEAVLSACLSGTVLKRSAVP